MLDMIFLGVCQHRFRALGLCPVAFFHCNSVSSIFLFSIFLNDFSRDYYTFFNDFLLLGRTFLNDFSPQNYIFQSKLPNIFQTSLILRSARHNFRIVLTTVVSITRLGNCPSLLATRQSTNLFGSALAARSVGESALASVCT